MCSPGQTEAAHGLCTVDPAGAEAAPPAGRAWGTTASSADRAGTREIYPQVREFIEGAHVDARVSSLG